MKPFQFYGVKKFPDIRQDAPIRTQIQLSLSGEFEDVETVVALEAHRFEGSMSKLRITSEIVHTTPGFIKTLVDEKRQRFDFNQYLEPVDFAAFHDPQREVVIFQAPKKVCRGVLSNLHRNTPQIELVEMSVDFVKVSKRVQEYFGAWFKGVSTNVHSANLSGAQIQDDGLFQKLSSQAQISNVTIPWRFEGTDHRVMVTGAGAVVLVQEYRNNQGLELRLIADVHDGLLKHVWEEKAKGRRCSSDDCPGDP